MMPFLLLVSTGLFLTKMRAARARVNCWVKGCDTSQRDKQRRTSPTRLGGAEGQVHSLDVRGDVLNRRGEGMGVSTAKVEGQPSAAAGVEGGTAMVGRLSLPGGRGPW